MPHSLFELSQMSREQLETIAKQHSIKNVKKLDEENLAYAIIDAEAIEASTKVSAAPEKPKRGRPKKENAQKKESAPKAEAAKMAELQSKYKIASMDNEAKLIVANLQNQREMLKLGYIPDGNGGYIYDENVAKRHSNGGGSSSVVPIALSAYGDLPEETININIHSLENTVKANILAGVVDDLSQEDQQALMSLIGGDRIAALTGTSGTYSDRIDRMVSYIIKSPKLRNLVKKAAAGTGGTEAPEAGDNGGVKLDENGFPE